MAITNYGELKSAVADWAERSDLTTRIEDFIRAAHDVIARDMIVAVDVDIDSSGVDLPNDCRDVVALYALAEPVALLTLASGLQMVGNGTGTPRRLSIDTGALSPSPDQDFDGRLLYRMSRQFFYDDSSTNTILTRYPMLYLHGALAELFSYLRDDNGFALYGGKFRDGLADAKRAEQEQTPQGMLQTYSGLAV